MTKLEKIISSTKKSFYTAVKFTEEESRLFKLSAITR